MTCSQTYQPTPLHACSLLSILILVCLLTPTPSWCAQPRIKDITQIQGVRSVDLVGYGLITGLNGTGDSPNLATSSALRNMLQRLGSTIPLAAIRSKNSAAVIVTASLPPYAKRGSALDVTVSSMVDAKSLQGGTLQPTVLTYAMDPKRLVYATASGEISLGGFSAGEKQGVQKNHTTAGKVPAGGVVEKELPVELMEDEQLVFVLYRADFTTATNIASAVNQHQGAPIAQAIDAATIQIEVPETAQANLSEFISAIGSLRVEVDNAAIIIIDERTGTIVIGEQVQISPVAVTHGNLHVEVSNESRVVQPKPFTDGTTATEQKSQVVVTEEDDVLRAIPDSTSIQQVVDALNMLGATPRDLVAILQNIARQGALHAQLIIR